MRIKQSRSLIVAQSAATLAVLLLSFSAFARPLDTIGGPGSDAQTIGHCGLIPVARMIYTNESRNVAIIQRHLTGLGYYHGAVDGVNSRITKAAVLAFQQDYGLRPDAVVGQETVQALAFLAHPIANVRTCKRIYHVASR
jgi:peptidoglycan hydrolase-like protein with peptidoglycan-binding domain